jgi:hypothetical protein
LIAQNVADVGLVSVKARGLGEKRKRLYKIFELLSYGRRSGEPGWVSKKTVGLYTGEPVDVERFEKILVWLQINGLLTSQPGKGYMPIPLPPGGFCWMHGRVKLEGKCQHCENAKKDREIRRKTNELRARNELERHSDNTGSKHSKAEINTNKIRSDITSRYHRQTSR